MNPLDKIKSALNDKDTLEKLSKIEHDQWMKWAKAVLPEVSEKRQKRWKKLFVRYEALSDKMKEYDREYARKVLKFIEGKSMMFEDDILHKIKRVLNESVDIKAIQAQSLGLTHVSFNNYKDRSGNPWYWDEKRQIFINESAPKFKKGDEVYELGSWDDKGTFYIKRLRVESWGKEQGTATNLSDGNFTKERFYTQHTNRRGHTQLLSVKTVSEDDAKKQALELAAKYIASKKQEYLDKIANNEDKYNYHKAMQDSINALHEPQVIMR